MQISSEETITVFITIDDDLPIEQIFVKDIFVKKKVKNIHIQFRSSFIN